MILYHPKYQMLGITLKETSLYFIIEYLEHETNTRHRRHMSMIMESIQDACWRPLTT